MQVLPSSVQWQSTTMAQHVLPCIPSVLRVQHSWQSLEAAYSKAHATWKQQKSDDELEQEIISTVQTRKEPARQIARRLKDKPRGDDESSKLNQQQDGRELLECAVEAWTAAIVLLHLGLDPGKPCGLPDPRSGWRWPRRWQRYGCGL